MLLFLEVNHVNRDTMNKAMPLTTTHTGLCKRASWTRGYAGSDKGGKNCSLNHLRNWKAATKALPTGGVFPTANTLQFAACWHQKRLTHALRGAAL